MFIGLDIGSTALRVCSFDTLESGQKLRFFDSEALSEGTVSDGEILHPAGVVEALRAVLERSELPAKRFVAVVPQHKVVVQCCAVTRADGSFDLEEARSRVQEQIPQSWGPYAVSASNYGEHNRDASLIVAVPQTSVDTLAEIVQQAGGELIGVDVAPSACFNLAEQRGLHQGNTVVLDVGLRQTRIVLLTQGTIHTTHIIDQGGQFISNTLQRVLDLRPEEAESYKRGGGSQSEGVIPRDVHVTLQNACDSLAKKISDTLQMLLEQSQVPKLTHVLCLGRGADLPFFYESLEKYTGSTIEVSTPLSSMNFDPIEYTSEYLVAIEGSASLAYSAVLPWKA